MKKKHIGFELSIFDNKDELSPEELKVLKKAEQARENAYAPYSNFKVGAAVLLENGEIVIGNNQENSSYPSGLCAERVAIFQAGARYPGVVIKSIAITATSKDYDVNLPAGPCGNCRQSIIEYEQKQKSPISIVLYGKSGPIYKCSSMADILPLAFNSSFLSDS
ncbi:Cytidine deaminase [Flagellimonas maritima]|uniref:Cytidine deaminase n=1 Tax=Flagellimonas maritima TaxID=1383885 RepID=A0A2Z4LQ21_9FLAO|nr:cytidine deaminase [Allomuricauda aurantiaca]AWX43872.1 Cytidine deaminase [Allomuricauda aurantiaca]